MLPEHREIIAAVRQMNDAQPTGPIYVLDIGMNIGAVTIGILAACPNCIVYGFEPVPHYFLFTKKKVDDAFPARAKLFNYAVCDENKHTTIHVDSGSQVNIGWNTLISSKKTAGQTDLQITCVTLESVFAHILLPDNVKRIDFMKIDVEGGERLVFAGARNLLATHPLPKPLIHVEVGWANNRADWKEETDEFEFLFRNGYERFGYHSLHGTQNLFIRPTARQ